jgi:hypothetical protein
MSSILVGTTENSTKTIQKPANQMIAGFSFRVKTLNYVLNHNKKVSNSVSTPKAE